MVTSYQTIAMYTLKDPVILRGFLRRAPQELWTSWGEWISRHGQRVFGKAVGSVVGVFEDYLQTQTGTVFSVQCFFVVVAASSSSRSHVGKTWNVHS